MRIKKSTIILVLIFLLGLGLLIYPTFSNWWNERHQSRAIATYEEAVQEQDDTETEEMLAAADAYNARLLAERESGDLMMGRLTDEQIEEYDSLLDITGTGIMGYVRIPKIGVELPIYHGTDDAVLQIAVGHIEGSSLPIGGTGTHAVVSGHRGLPSAKLFTEIDELGEGDVFMITCLNRKVTYQVDQILTVLPNELESLEIDPDQDYCTLVTCTPYGINSHRLLVRGHRIANLVDEDIETIDIAVPEREYTLQERLQQILPYLLILTSGFFGFAMILPSRKRREDEEEREWQERARRREDRRRGRGYGAGGRDDRDGRYESRYDDRDSDRYDEYEDEGYGQSRRRSDRRSEDPWDQYRDDRYDDGRRRPGRDDRRYRDDDRYVQDDYQGNRLGRREDRSRQTRDARGDYYEERRTRRPAMYEEEPMTDDLEFLDDDDGFYDED